MNKKDGGQCGNHKKKVGLPCRKNKHRETQLCKQTCQ